MTSEVQTPGDLRIALIAMAGTTVGEGDATILGTENQPDAVTPAGTGVAERGMMTRIARREETSALVVKSSECVWWKLFNVL